MNSELYRAQQRSNQRCGASVAASVIVFPGRDFASHAASRAAGKTLQVNRLSSRAVGQLRSPRSFGQHRAGVCIAILRKLLLTAARARLTPVHSAAKKVALIGSPTMPLTRRAKTHARYGGRSAR
jgi:hypothetical protein